MQNSNSKHIILKKTSLIFWASFLFLTMIEYLLFRNFVLRDIVNTYPGSFDQAIYLSKSYTLYENILNQNLVKAILHFPLQDTSFLFFIQAAFFFVFFGASRFSALFINFIYFGLVQLLFIIFIKEITRSYLASLLFLGFLLNLAFPFVLPGGMMDFRIDFITSCLYLILVLSVMKSNIFYDRGWTIIAATIAIFLVLMRYIACVYLAGNILTLICIFFIFLYSKKYEFSRKEIYRRLKNLFFFSAIIMTFTIPIMWINRHSIYAYYVVGHIISPEKSIREKEYGNTTFIKNLLYYPKEIYSLMGSNVLFLLVALFILTLTYYFVVKPKQDLTLDRKCALDYYLRVIFSTICVVVPLTILIFNDVKSPIVGDILVLPIILFIALVWSYFYEQLKDRKYNLKLFGFFTAIIIFCGLANWVNHFNHDHIYFSNNDLNQIIKMDIDIGNYAEAMGWKNVNVAADQTVDYLSVPLAADYYEHTHRLLNVVLNPLGKTIFSMSTGDAIKHLNESDVFITKLGEYPSSPYPSNQNLVTIRPVLQKIAAQKFIKLNDYYFDNSFYRVYVRPSFQIYGLSGDWITNRGIWIKLSPKLIKDASGIHLMGEINTQWLSKNVKVFAYGNIQDKNIFLPTMISINHNNYAIDIKLPNNVKYKLRYIHLIFSTYFVPQKLGINSDTSQLVVLAPTTKSITFIKNLQDYSG